MNGNSIAPEIGDTLYYDFSFSAEQVLIYAQISGDVNPIHVSNEYAATSDYGRCIVHGYFTTSIFSKVYGTILYPDGHILVSQSAKYIKPIFTGIEYTACFIVRELIKPKNRVLYENCIIEKQTGELKVTGEAMLMNKKFYRW